MLSIGPGGYHTMALSLSGKVFLWGHNRVGQLGFKSEKEYHSESLNDFEDDSDDNMYYQKEPKIVNDLSNILVKSVSAGWGHSAILSIDGNIYMCGRNFRGQIGKSLNDCEINSRGHPYSPKFELLTNINEKIEKVVCGGEHTAAITKEGRLYLWGDDFNGQLGHKKKVAEVYIDISKYYKVKPKLIEGEPCIGIVKDIILGSTITFFINIKN